MLSLFCWHVTKSCSPGAHLVSSGGSWAFGSWSCISPNQTLETHKVRAGAPQHPLYSPGAVMCRLLMQTEQSSHCMCRVVWLAGPYAIPAKRWVTEVLPTCGVTLCWWHLLWFPRGTREWKRKARGTELNLPVIYETQEPHNTDMMIKKYAG